MSGHIVDASVLVKLLAREHDSALVRAAVARASEIWAPEFVFAQAYNALWKRWRRGDYLVEQLERAPAILLALVTHPVSVALLLPKAATISRQFDHPVHDCLYIALADRQQAPLITADKRLHRAAQSLGTVRLSPL